MMNAFKLRHWDHEGINLHSWDICLSRGPFSMLLNAQVRSQFIAEVSGLTESLAFTLFVTAIRKSAHVARHDAEATNPYDLALGLTLKHLLHLMESHDEPFHPFASTVSGTAAVESLTLGDWTALSGAAFNTGLGRGGSVRLALFMGIVNFRLGRWWNSGIRYEERPGRYAQNLWRRIKRLPISLFNTQSLLLSEWQARFHGPNRWHWYLSDGGHFEVTGAYELIRRRLRFIVLSDAGEDPDYQFKDLSTLTRQVRGDFGATIQWLDVGPKPPTTAASAATASPSQPPDRQILGRLNQDKWTPYQSPGPDWMKDLPDYIKEFINPEALGKFKELRRDGHTHAALARITYDDDAAASSWLLLLKPGLAGDELQDVQQYAAAHKDFPQQPTFDQVFDDAQWESYRALGEHIGAKALGL